LIASDTGDIADSGTLITSLAPVTRVKAIEDLIPDRSRIVAQSVNDEQPDPTTGNVHIDLSDLPNVQSAITQLNNNKANKPAIPVNGDVATFDKNGNLVDLGTKLSDLATDSDVDLIQ
jgi:hypothetical protein